MTTATVLSAEEVLDIICSRFEISNHEVNEAIRKHLDLFQAEIRIIGHPRQYAMVITDGPHPLPPPKIRAGWISVPSASSEPSA